MVEAADSLVLDLVEWIAREPRPYSEVIATWRTSCPRLTIWEDAVDWVMSPAPPAPWSSSPRAASNGCARTAV